ncbi:unnamed protein product [Blepharisma stoltei]|uniref:Beach-domain-containing protein n=1 Tax=Blepharisma stoltei TaxID=1481888 RepID=A0AAU9K5S8_9CILI|nr:unnamed protein product [Blepharisma stoltei]
MADDFKLSENLQDLAQDGSLKDSQLIWRICQALPSLPQSQQLSIIDQLLDIARCKQYNPSLILSLSMRSPIDNRKEYLLNNLIKHMVFAEPEVQEKLSELISFLIHSVGANLRHTHFVFQILANNQLDYKSITAAIRVLQVLISPNKSSEPYSYFYFTGRGCGLQITQKKPTIFPFKNAISICLWFRLEKTSEEVSRLFTFHSQGNGGVEAYFVENTLYYRSLGTDYNPPGKGSNGIRIFEFATEEWIFLALENEKQKYGKKQLRVAVNGEEICNTTMDFPKIKDNAELTLAAVGLNFTGEISAIMVFSELISMQKMKLIFQKYSTWGPQGHESLRSLCRVVDKSLGKKLVMFYHPLHTYQNIVYDGQNFADGKLFGVSGVKAININRISNIGGIGALLPILEKIKAVRDNNGELLLEWMMLLIISLQDLPENQKEATSINFFRCVAEILIGFDKSNINDTIIDMLEQVYSICAFGKLKDQLVNHLLWCVEIWKETDHVVQNQLYKLIRKLYNKSSREGNKFKETIKILDIVIEHYNLKENIDEDTKKHISDIISIIEICLISGGEETASDIEQIVSVLYSKPSTFIQYNLLQLLKKLINEKTEEMLGVSPLMFAKHFVEAAGLELLLYLISSSSTEIRGYCLSIISSLYNLPLKQVQIGNQKDVFTFISSIILPHRRRLSEQFKPWQLRNNSVLSDIFKTSVKTKIDSLNNKDYEEETGIRPRLSLDNAIMPDDHRGVKPIQFLNYVEEVHQESSTISNIIGNEDYIAQTEVELPSDLEEKEQNMLFTRDQPRHNSATVYAINDQYTARKNEEEGVYYAVLEIMLNKPFGGQSILDDFDYIQNKTGLFLFEETVSRGSLELKHRAVQDLLMLTKWNIENANILAQDSDWHYWLLNLLCETPETEDTGVAVYDIGTRAHNIVMKQAVLADDEGWRHLRRLIYWYEKNRTIDNSRTLIRSLLEKLMESLQSISMGCRPSITSILWKNLINTSYLLEEFVIYSKIRSEDSYGQYLVYCGLEWEDASIMEKYFSLLDPIWPSALFQDNLMEPDHIQLLSSIKRNDNLFKTDIQILQWEPPNDIKARGWFIKVVLHLAASALKATANSEQIDKWLSEIIKIVKFILLVSESGKKSLTSSGAKAFSQCIIYVIGVLVSYINDLRGHPVTKKLQDSCIDVLKFVFAVYDMGRSDWPQGFKGFIRAGFTPVSVAEEVVAFLVQNVPEFELIDVNFSGHYIGLEGLLMKEEWRIALLNASLPIFELFESRTRASLICQHREKVAEKLTKDKENYLKQSEETNAQMHRFVLNTASEKSDEVDKTISTVLAQSKEKSKKRKAVWSKQLKILTEWRGPWQVLNQKLSFEPYQAMDCNLSRNFLKKKSDHYDFYLIKHRTQITAPNPQLLNEINPNILKKDLTEEVDEEDEERTLPETEDSMSLKFSFTAHADSPLLNTVAKETVIQVEVGIIKLLTIQYGLLQVTYTKKEQKIRFLLDQRIQNKFSSHVELFHYIPSPNKPLIKEWNLDLLSYVFPKTYIMRHTAAEFFFNDGRSVLVNFASHKDRLNFVTHVKKIRKSAVPRLQLFKKPNPIKLVAESGMTEKWVNWHISNFEYLMFLNFAGGRSYHDLTQYPVFPWVIRDYSSPVLDPEASLRDLSLNMGSLGKPERTQSFIERYNSFSSNDDTPSFHFGSHYSNPGIVLQYLVRLFPYSEGAKELQGGHFDLPDRLFNSISESFQSATEDICDVRELIPEFFVLPDFLLNKEEYHFGTTQTGKEVWDVTLPAWASDAYEFVRINREILESNEVSKNIHKWIDLIFGFKQIGKDAKESMNLFYYMTYENSIDLDKVEDPSLRAAVEAQVVNFGKTPSQLFTKPHHPKEDFRRITSGPTIVSKESVELKTYFPSNRKALLRPENLISYFDLSERSIIKAKFYKDKDIIAIRNNGNMVRYNWWPAPMGESKTPFTCALNKEVQFYKMKEIGEVEALDRSIRGFNASIEIIQQGKNVIIGGFWDGRLTIQKHHTKESNHKWVHYSTITCTDVDIDERVVVTGGKDGDVVVWQIDNDNLHHLWHFFNHDEQVTFVTICQELHTFASCSLDGTCNIYSLTKGRLLRVINIANNIPISIVKFSTSAPAKVILFSSEENMFYSYAVNGAQLHRNNERCKFVNSPMIVKDMNFRDFLIYGTESGDIVIRYAGTLEVLRRFTLSGGIPVISLIATRDLKFLLFGCADGELGVLTDPAATFATLEKQWQLNVFSLV